MSLSPEFRRNIWLEFSDARIVGMPAVIGAVLLLAYVSTKNTDDCLSTVALVSVVMFVLIVILWGTRLASEAVAVEIRDGTWDSQRMSSVTPWSMAWGKLFGSTAYTWYGGLICMSAYMAVAFADGKPRILNTAALYISCSLLGHATALLVSVQTMIKERKYQRSQATAFFVVGIFLPWMLLSPALAISGGLDWYGMEFDGRDFMLASVLVFLGWVVFGIYRLMRTELQVKNGPFAWLFFVTFVAIYASGFTPPEMENFTALEFRFTVQLAVCIGFTYIMALNERKDPVAFRRLWRYLEGGEWEKAFKEIPCWAVTLIPVFIAACGLIATARPGSGIIDSLNVRLSVLATLMFLLRDLGIVLWLNFTRNPKRADMIMVLALIMLYGVIPGIMQAIGLESARALFWPTLDRYSFMSVLAASVEAMFVVVLVIVRWKALYRSREARSAVSA